MSTTVDPHHTILPSQASNTRLRARTDNSTLLGLSRPHQAPQGDTMAHRLHNSTAPTDNYSHTVEVPCTAINLDILDILDK